MFPNALTREIVGVLSGSKLSGGSRKGARFFLFSDDTEAFGSSVWVTLLVAPKVIPRLRLVDAVDVGSVAISVDTLMGVISLCFGGSGGTEDCTANSALIVGGDTKLFGNGGTGGISSSSFDCRLTFAVGNLEREIFWLNRG